MFICILDINIQIQDCLPAPIPVELNSSKNNSLLKEIKNKGWFKLFFTYIDTYRIIF